MDTRSIYITGKQACKLHRLARDGEIVTASTSDERLAPLDDSIHQLDDLHVGSLISFLDVGDKSPLSLLVPNDASRRWTSSLRTSVITSDLPSGSFLELHPGKNPKKRIELPDDTRVFIDAPWLAILQSARVLEHSIAHGTMSRLSATLRLMEFADECCGSYYQDANKPRVAKAHFDDINECTRFTDADSLRRAIELVHDIDGIKLARVAVRYAIDGSGSPMESYLNHAMTLPPRLGGLSMRKPLVNAPLQVDESVWAKLKHDCLRPDLQWPDQKMLVEYLGDEEHAGKPARTEDKNRIQDYMIAQYATFPLMFDDVRNKSALGKTAMMLAREFMRRGVRKEAYRVSSYLRDEDFLAQQGVLIATLLPPVTRYE